MSQDPDQIFGAADEPIRRQRQTVDYLESISGLISHQTKSMTQQNEQILTALKYLARVTWILVILVAAYVVRHW